MSSAFGSKSRTVIWGVISTASINQRVLPAFDVLEHASVRSVASRDPDRARIYADDNRIPESHGSYESLLEDPDLDCVYISTPNSTHAEWIEAALMAGKHVLCEKPLTPSASEAERLFNLATERGLLLMEAFMYRHHPQTELIKQVLLGGEVGELKIIRSWFNFRAENPRTDVRYRRDLAGGALLDVGSYCINFSTFIMDSAPDQVEGVASMTPGGVDETFAGTMRFGDVVVVFDCSINTPLDMGFTAVGTQGILTATMPWYPHLEGQETVLVQNGKRTELSCPGRNPYELEVANFSSAILGDGEPLVTMNETFRNLATLERLALAAGA